MFEFYPIRFLCKTIGPFQLYKHFEGKITFFFTLSQYCSIFMLVFFDKLGKRYT